MTLINNPCILWCYKQNKLIFQTKVLEKCNSTLQCNGISATERKYSNQIIYMPCSCLDMHIQYLYRTWFAHFVACAYAVCKDNIGHAHLFIQYLKLHSPCKMVEMHICLNMNIENLDILQAVHIYFYIGLLQI